MGSDSSKIRTSSSQHEKLPSIKLPVSASYYEGMYRSCEPPLSRSRNGSTHSRGSVKHPLSVKMRRLIASCFANPHEMLGKRIMKRACDLKDEFATFYTSLELESREEMEDSMKILLKKVVTNIDFLDEVTRLSEEFGQRFVELRSQGFRADYFAVLADATIKECTHLDSAVHKAHTTTQAFSQFGALVFSSVRDGFYTEVRRIRRASNSFSTGSNSSMRRKKSSGDGDGLPRSQGEDLKYEKVYQFAIMSFKSWLTDQLEDGLALVVFEQFAVCLCSSILDTIEVFSIVSLQ
ncbi:unnamed protein product [Nippostrongylus brasiliensis]|uniref:Exocyst complex component Sec10 n=1 Tax=Nippostrongylus brasiliensis TaxID=27835 RepID=A0A0N4XVR7_NIPBR|nr:unnamed protein product [Nippostrongylus brasiliensis]